MKTLSGVAIVFLIVLAMASVVPSADRQVPYTLYADYAFNVGSSRSVDALGIGTYEDQLKRAQVSAKFGVAVQIVPPDDAIKRSRDKTIYGTSGDPRREFFQIPDPVAKENARAVASISLRAERTVFAKGICTAFLISTDMAMTASHCVNGNDFPTKVVRFNDQWVGDGFLDQIDSYDIDAVAPWDRTHDFAILKLRRNSSGELPGGKYPVLKLQKAPVQVRAPLYLVGHAAQDYKKYVDNCAVITRPYLHPDGKRTFGCDCTAFGGNSGSPVFSKASNQVVGVFWGGQKDDRQIRLANQTTHEFVVPMWEIATTSRFDVGTWPSQVGFASLSLALSNP